MNRSGPVCGARRRVLLVPVRPLPPPPDPQCARATADTAVAKSNIFVNAPNETKYFYQDLDASGARLNGGNRYTVTFAKDQTPPVHGS